MKTNKSWEFCYEILWINTMYEKHWVKPSEKQSLEKKLKDIVLNERRKAQTDNFNHMWIQKIVILDDIV